MATAAQHAEYLGRGWRVFAFCPGITQSEMTRRINVYDGAKPTSRGAAPLVGIVDGERDADADAGRFLTADTESGVYMNGKFLCRWLSSLMSCQVLPPCLLSAV